MSAYLDLETSQTGIAELIMQRTSKHNAFDARMITELTQALSSIQANPNIKIVIIRAKGPHFCAGADLNWMQQSIHASLKENKRDAKQLSRLFYQLYHFPKPTLALVHGACYGGGIGLVACCDMALASQQSQFCFSEVKMGLIPATISPYILNAIGQRQAMRYCLTAERFDGYTAKQIGLVHDCVSEDKLEFYTKKWITQLQKNSPQAMQETKALLHKLDQMPISFRLMKKTATLIAKARVSPRGQEGVRAFLERRAPNWDQTTHD